MSNNCTWAGSLLTQPTFQHQLLKKNMNHFKQCLNHKPDSKVKHLTLKADHFIRYKWIQNQTDGFWSNDPTTFPCKAYQSLKSVIFLKL